MNIDTIIIATTPHPDDKCSCGTTGNGAKPETQARMGRFWFWRDRRYETESFHQYSEHLALQQAIDTWAAKFPNERTNRRCIDLFDRAMLNTDLRQAVEADAAGKPVQFFSAAWERWENASAPTFDPANKQWRAKPDAKPGPTYETWEWQGMRWVTDKDKSERAKKLQAAIDKWAHRAIVDDAARRCALYTRAVLRPEHGDLILAWADGKPVEITWNNQWIDAACPNFESHATFRIKPRTDKVRARFGILRGVVTGDARVYDVYDDESAKALEAKPNFIQWLGPWQEAEIEREAGK